MKNRYVPFFNKEVYKIVLIYAVFGSAWIYFSDTALGWFIREPETMTQLAIFKGFFFIIATSGLLWFLLVRMHAKIERSIRSLGESEQRFNFLLKNSSDSLVIINGDGSQRYVSSGAERITGFPVAELEGKTLEALIHADDMKDIMIAWQELVAHPEKTVTVQYRHIHKTRGWVFSEAIAQSFLDEPVINGVVASVRDITERKQAEQELMRKDALLRAMLRNLPFDYWARDTEQRILLQSVESIHLWGDLAADAQSGWQFDAETVARWQSNNNRVLKGETISGYCTYLTKSGEKRDFHEVVAPIREGEGILGILGINIDITDQKRTLEDLRLSNDLLSAFIKHSPIYAYIKEVGPTESRVLKVSDNFEEMISIPGSEMAGKSMHELFPADFAAKITADDWEVISRQEILQVDEELHGRSYTTIKFPILLGEKNYLAGYTIDLTERKQAEEEKKKLQGQLTQAQKMESVGRLAGGVAHDFNNMLGVILGYSELIMDKLQPDQPIYPALKGIQQAAERSVGLTRQLLAFARKQTISPKVIDLNHVVESMLRMLQRLIGEDIVLAWLPGKNLWFVKMDPSQIDQMLANLCVNARDAIKDTGKITIETDNRVLDAAYCSKFPGFAAGEYVLLAVTDNGSGMSPEVIAHLFEPFFTTKEMDKGTGLGLATVYGIVKQNHGFIDVYSEPGQGTTLTIYLPRHAAPADQVVGAEGGESVASGHETILLVEDEPMILEMTTAMLERLGYRVITATAPTVAIDLAREHADRIHLLLTDVIMPEMSGRGLAQELFAISPKIKCLFMSGYTANVIAHHGVLDDGVHFIQKPFSVKDLAVKVREVLGATTGNMDREIP